MKAFRNRMSDKPVPAISFSKMILISVIAYASDLVLLARQKQSLQDLLDAASSAATTIGLEFRQDKSASLSLVKSKRAEHQDEPVQRNVFTI